MGNRKSKEKQEKVEKSKGKEDMLRKTSDKRRKNKEN